MIRSGVERMETTQFNSYEHRPSSAIVARRSVHVECVGEADRFKWIESEKAGHDLGERAIKNWIQQHWWDYLRARWLAF